MKKLTLEQHIRDFGITHGDKYDYNEIKEVVDSNTKIIIICKKHNHKFSMKINNHKHGQGCKKCKYESLGSKFRKTNQEIDEILIREKRNIKRLEDCISSTRRIKWKHLKESCMYEWIATPSSIINDKTGCPKCGNRLPLTNEVVDKRLFNIKIKRIGIITNARTRILWQCIKCNNTWNATPDSILNAKSGCPKCKGSHGETSIRKLLEKSNINFVEQKIFKDCKNPKTGWPLKFDFYLPEYNCCIEFDGDHHFFPPIKSMKSYPKRYNVINYEIIKFRDELKTNYCSSNNIKLIRIHCLQLKTLEKFILEKLHHLCESM